MTRPKNPLQILAIFRVSVGLTSKLPPQDSNRNPRGMPLVGTSMETTNIGKTLLLCGLSIVLGALNVYLFFNHEIGLNFPIFVVSAIIVGVIISSAFLRRLSNTELAVLATAIFFATMVYFRASEALTVFNVLATILSLLTFVAIMTRKNLRSFVTLDYIKVVLLPFSFLAPFFATISEVVSLRNIGSKNPRTKEIIRGSIMALVALVVFTWLFASADAVVGKILSNFFSFNIPDDFFGRVILGTFVASFCIGAFSFIFRKVHAEPLSAEPTKRNLGMLETKILLGSVCTLFFAFILLQISYLFGGAEHLLAEGLTYAEYAREGFGQLVFVAVLSFIIISFTARQIEQRDGSHPREFKILSGILVIEVIAILVSAFSRLSLYENAYGFSEARLWSHAFMIWLAFGLLLLAYHIWKDSKDSTFSFYAFCSIVVFLATMNTVNPDVFIAQQNLERYEETGKIDAAYLASLSTDALPYTIHLLDDKNEDVRKTFASELYWQQHWCTADTTCGDRNGDNSWQAPRATTREARELLSTKQAQIEASKDYIPTPISED